jgi:hypothetical protein
MVASLPEIEDSGDKEESSEPEFVVGETEVVVESTARSPEPEVVVEEETTVTDIDVDENKDDNEDSVMTPKATGEEDDIVMAPKANDLANSNVTVESTSLQKSAEDDNDNDKQEEGKGKEVMALKTTGLAKTTTTPSTSLKKSVADKEEEEEEEEDDDDDVVMTHKTAAKSAPTLNKKAKVDVKITHSEEGEDYVDMINAFRPKDDKGLIKLVVSVYKRVQGKFSALDKTVLDAFADKFKFSMYQRGHIAQLLKFKAEKALKASPK